MQKPKFSNLFRFSILGNVLALILAVGVILWLGGPRHFMNKLKNRGLTAEYAMQKDQLAVLPADSMDIVFLGNSLIANGIWSEWLPNYQVANRGIRGDGIEGVKDRLFTIKKLAPQQIFLLIGINDLAYHQADWVVEHYANMLDALKDELSGVKVWVQSILPVNNSVKDTGHSNSTIVLVNKELEGLAQSRGFEYLDLHPLFADQDGNLKAEWTLDGIHLTGVAYETWTAYLKKEVLLKTDEQRD